MLIVLKLLDTHICYDDQSIGQKNRSSITEAVRAGVRAITPNDRRYIYLVELYVRHDPLSNAPTYSSTKLARQANITGTRPRMPGPVEHRLEEVEICYCSSTSICRVHQSHRKYEGRNDQPHMEYI